MKTLKVVLRQDVPSLGRRGEVVEVKTGYARNYLLPRGLALLETPENLAQIEREKEKHRAELEARKADLLALREKLAQVSCTIEAKASPEGHLYGSVNAQMIVEAFAREGLRLDPDWVELERPIKELGAHEVKLRLHPEIEAVAKVWVVEAEGRG